MTFLLQIPLGATFGAITYITAITARADYHRFGWHPLWRVTTEHIHQDTP